MDTLKDLNIDRYLLRWIKSYLLNRSQSVAVEGYDLSLLPVVSGVPQGSVLGPLLFITYINNVTSVVSTDSELNLFADDIALYRIIKSTADYAQLQTDIDSISSFISGKHLKFNAKKCRQMLVSRKTVHSLPSATLTIDGTPLTLVTEYKYLGVTIASNLSWNVHITNICNKTRRLVGMFYRRFYTNSSPESLLKLYVSYIRPHLEYCSPVWDPQSKKLAEDLENVQKFALKMCTKCWDSNYETLLAATQLPTLEKRRTKASLCHLFKNN